MMSARAEMLARIRAAVRDSTPATPVPRGYRGAGETTVNDPAALLIDRLRDYRAQVRRCRADDVATTIADLLAGRAASNVLVPAGFPAEWLSAGLVRASAPTVDELDASDGVVTGCAVAIATTGTIVLDHEDGQGPRMFTLVPDHHLIVVRSDQIVAGVPDAIARLDPTRPQTWISGPSATSDIELDRVEGVHGPRHLQVLLAD